MYKIRDILGKNVLNKEGKILGIVDDIIINIYEKKVIGIRVKKKGLIKKRFYVLTNDIIYFGLNIIIKNVCEGQYFTFDKIKFIEVYSLNGNIIGIVEDIIFSEINFYINSIIVTEGFFKNYSKGKRILLLKDIIIGDKNIIYTQNNSYLCYSKIHGVKDYGNLS